MRRNTLANIANSRPLSPKKKEFLYTQTTESSFQSIKPADDELRKLIVK